jgi:hypothetical protein
MEYFNTVPSLNRYARPSVSGRQEVNASRKIAVANGRNLLTGRVYDRPIGSEHLM